MRRYRYFIFGPSSMSRGESSRADFNYHLHFARLYPSQYEGFRFVRVLASRMGSKSLFFAAVAVPGVGGDDTPF